MNSKRLTPIIDAFSCTCLRRSGQEGGRTRIALLGCLFLLATMAHADVRALFTETPLGNGSFQYDYTLYNTFDPNLNPGVDLYDVQFALDGTTTANVLSVGQSWSSFVTSDFIEIVSFNPGEPPVGSDIAPGTSLSGFSFVFDQRVGPLPFTALLTDPDNPGSPILVDSVSEPAVQTTAPEPDTLLLCLSSILCSFLLLGRHRVPSIALENLYKKVR